MNDKIEKLLNCNDCKLTECIQCEISYNDKKMIREYIQEQEKIINEMADRLTTDYHDKEWVIEYYKEKVKDE